ncbi:acyl-CoA dehydrogenase family protein [Novosphingobium sp. KCTC 2891]|uniref:acyl-CoA dehydrogenase family protein n=1 Tax=Novosphingobium sp. KCTC 2891 TaxID=2989730 RepID=UPI00222367ED|nr:acyl-CoA dehydrogenase family protein [Novosphingobium sp. KCTC 2891]MCW1382940.1 acyl-CoA dehydrogenase family protein [Novosphingobium sp. KCTC 2891]
MDMILTDEDRAFEQEVRDFLGEQFTPQLRSAAARQAGVFAEGELARTWHSILYRKGWIAPTWPREHGGPGWTAMQRYIYERECGLAGTPALPAMGLALCGPVIMRFGTQAQKDFFLPKMLSGEHYWCQGFSEPGSGSDLASLRTRAEREGDHYVVNGTKIWTTHAHEANWIFLLVRTRKDGPSQAGISFLLAPMDLPGMTVTPILSMSGEHEVNQVFFDNVRVPAEYLVGEENQGWEIAKYLLAFERGGGSAAGRLNAQLAKLKDIARSEPGEDGAPLWDDMRFRERIMRLETEIMAIDWTERRQIAKLVAGDGADGAMPSILKLSVSELYQKLAQLSSEALGVHAIADQRHALGLHANEPPIGPDHGLTPTARYLNTRAATIFGGSSEIQRGIIAKSLGL